MKIVITQKEYNEMLSLERFRNTSPCNGCYAKTALCGNECSNLWDWEEEYSKHKTETTDKLSEILDIVELVKITIEMENIESKLKELHIKYSELDKKRTILKGTKEIQIISEQKEDNQ